MDSHIQIPRTVFITRIAWLDEMYQQTKDEQYKGRSNELRFMMEYYDQDND